MNQSLLAIPCRVLAIGLRAPLMGLIGLLVVVSSCRDAGIEILDPGVRPVVETTPYPRLWGTWHAVLPDLDGDGIGDIAVANGVSRRSASGRFLGPGVNLYSGRDGGLIGELSDLPFQTTLFAIDGLADLHGKCTGLVVGGIMEADPPRLYLALLNSETLIVEKEAALGLGGFGRLGDGPLSYDLWVRICHFSGPDGLRVVAFVSDGRYRAGAYAWDVESGTDPFVFWPVRKRTGLVAGGFIKVPDVDGDGVEDIAISLTRDRGHRSGIVLLLSGATNQVIWEYSPPGSLDDFGIALSAPFGESSENPILVVGSPDWVRPGEESGGKVFVVDLHALALRTVFTRPTLPSGHRIGAHDTFGKKVGTLSYRERQIVIVADFQGAIPGVLRAFDVNSSKLIWSLYGEDDFLIGDGSFYSYGNGIIRGPLSGTSGWMVISAQMAFDAAGRVFVVDGVEGRIVYELKPQGD